MSWGGVIFEIHYLNNKIKKRIQPLNLEVESPSTLLPLYRRRFSLFLSCVMLMECRVGGGLFGATRIIPQRSSSYSHQKRIFSQGLSPCRKRSSFSSISNKLISAVPRCSGSSNSTSDEDEDKTSNSQKTKPFGYSRKDVILIGVGVTAAGVGLKSGLEYVGVDPLQAGNVVQLVLVLGLTIGWISTYIFRVSNKEMTYAQQLRDYEDKVMQKRLESLTEAEIEALYEQVEEEKSRLSGEQVK